MIVNFGIMGWTNIWLDMTTAAISAMGVSIGADFAIYLMFRIREEFATSGDVRTALTAASRTSGKALIYVSSAIALGYLVLPFSQFSLWVHLGVLTATIVSTSALCTLTTLPALAYLLRPRVLFRRGGGAPLVPVAEPRAKPKAAEALF